MSSLIIHRENRVFAVAIWLMVLARFLQNTELISWRGLKPNLILTVLLVACWLLEDWRYYSVLTLVTLTLSGSSSIFDLASLAILILAVTVFFGKKLIGWRPLVGSLVFIGFGTFLFYSLINYQFVSNSPSVILWELIGNIFVALLIYPTLRLVK